jgi:[ribosomal protein S18]-alanine N-acetyltransferase
MHSSGDDVARSPVIAVRLGLASDAPSLHAILGESPEAAIWSEKSLGETLSGGIGWVAEAQGGIAGFLVGRVAADEFEILNVAVKTALRRKGIATRLVSCATDHARASGARNAFLEVRASNAGAIGFYSRMRFLQCGRRPNYYSGPVEDAVMLVLHIDENNS